MVNCMILLTAALVGNIVTGAPTTPSKQPKLYELPQDAIFPKTNTVRAFAASDRQDDLKYQWMASDGIVYNESGPGRLEIASTPAITKEETDVGTKIVRLMTRNMPSDVFDSLASKASVGLFTKADKTTAFPEFASFKDRSECQGSCKDACSDTCTFDGRKYDSLAGLGGVRGVCLNDNFMCNDADPYDRQFNVLIHEFTHTIHRCGLTSEYTDKIRTAYQNARTNEIWGLGSYAMSNEQEYFAEGAGVFFNAEKLPTSTGGMNSCGHPAGTYCANETEARDWLEKKDPTLLDLLSFTFTNNRPTLPGGLGVCVTA